MKTTRSIFSLLFGGGVSTLGSGLGMLWIASLIGPAEFGVYGLMLAGILVISPICALRIDLLIGFSISKRRRRALYSIGINSSYLGSAIVAMAIYVMAHQAFTLPEVFGLYVTILASAKQGLLGAISISQHNLKALNISRNLRAYITPVVQGILISSGIFERTSSLLLLGILVGLAFSVVPLKLARREVANKQSRLDFFSTWRSEKRAILSVAIQSGINAVSQQIPYALLSMYATKEWLGIFGLCDRMVRPIVTLISTPVRQILTRDMYKLKGAKAEQRALFFYYTRQFFIFGIPFFALGILFSCVPFFVDVNLIPQQWRGAELIASPMILWAFSAILSLPALSALRALQSERVLVLYELMGFIFKWACPILGVLFIGLKAPGIINLISGIGATIFFLTILSAKNILARKAGP